MNQVGEAGREKELTRGQPLDDAHRRATARTRPRPRAAGGRCRRGQRRDGEDRSTRREIVRATARCEQPEVANADEALREDVQQEAPEEVVDVKRQRALLASMPQTSSDVR